MYHPITRRYTSNELLRLRSIGLYSIWREERIRDGNLLNAQRRSNEKGEAKTEIIIGKKKACLSFPS